MTLPKSGALLLSIALAVGAVPTAMAATLLVDDDRSECPAAPYDSIQAAVDAAATGDIVRVCAGTYEGRVFVGKTVLLQGPRKGVDARSRTLGGENEAVVRATQPFRIEAPNVVLDGFTIAVQLDEEGEGSGIFVAPAGSGYRILNNIIDASSAPGIELVGVAGTQAYVQRNQVRGPIGLRAEHGQVGNLTVRDNLFVNGTVRLADARHDAIHILRNTLRYSRDGVSACVESPALPCRPGIVLIGVGNILLQQNAITGSDHWAIYVDDGRRVRIIDNRLRAGSGIGIRIGNPSEEGISVFGNRIAGFVDTAILLHRASRVALEGNEVEDSEAGIVLVDASANRITANNIEDNATYGIDISGDAAGGNNVSRNEVRGNGVLDCRDQTTGTRSFGTANTWSDNEGSRSEPTGLCTDR